MHPLPTCARPLLRCDRPPSSRSLAALKCITAVRKLGGPLQRCDNPPKTCDIPPRNCDNAALRCEGAPMKWAPPLREWAPPLRKWVPPLREWGVGGLVGAGFSKKTGCHPYFSSDSTLETNELQRSYWTGCVTGLGGVSAACSKRSPSSAASALAPGMFTLAAALSEL